MPNGQIHTLVDNQPADELSDLVSTCCRVGEEPLHDVLEDDQGLVSSPVAFVGLVGNPRQYLITIEHARELVLHTV